MSLRRAPSVRLTLEALVLDGCDNDFIFCLMFNCLGAMLCPMAKKIEGIPWKAVEVAAIAGVKPAQLVQMHPQLTEANIRQRASRYKWALPAKVKSIAVTKSKNVSQDHEAQQELAAKTIAEQLATNGDDASLIASQMALGALQRAQKSKAGILPLLNIGDVKTALSTARTAAGMDKPQTAIQVNVGQVWSESLGTEATVRLA